MGTRRGRRAGKKTNNIMVRLNNVDRARFDHLKTLRRDVLGVTDEDGPLMGTSGMRDAERQIKELEALREQRLSVGEPALQSAGSPA